MNDTVEASRLKESFLGEELEPEEIKALQGIFGVERLAAGDVLVREDAEDSRLFLLAEGEIEVLSRQHGEEEQVHRMRPGEFAGTRAFIDRAPRRATLRAARDSVVYTLTPEDFESLLETHPRLVYKIMRAIFRITHVNLMRMNKEARELINYVVKTRGRY